MLVWEIKAREQEQGGQSPQTRPPEQPRLVMRGSGSVPVPPVPPVEGPSRPLAPPPLWGNLRCTARAVGSPAGLSLWQWVRAVPKGLSFRDRPVYISLEIIPTDGAGHPLQAHLEQPLSPVASSGAFADATPPGESEDTHRVLLSWGVPSVPRPHHGLTPAVAVAVFPQSCRLSAPLPPRPLAGSPLPWVTGLPRQKSLSQQRRCCGARGTKRLRCGPGQSRGPAAAEPPCPDLGRGREGIHRVRIASPASVPLLLQAGRGQTSVQVPQPMITTARPAGSSPAWGLWSRGSPGPPAFPAFPGSSAFPGAQPPLDPQPLQDPQHFQDPQHYQHPQHHRIPRAPRTPSPPRIPNPPGTPTCT